MFEQSKGSIELKIQQIFSNVLGIEKNKTITIDNGDKIQVSYCPDCDGMIKSPMCCGNDMSCEI